MALQELQQRIDELTADHKASITAMKTAHSEEIESLREALSSQLAVEMHAAEAADGLQSNGVSGKAVDALSSAVCSDSSLGVQSPRDLAALYQDECRRTACLQSTLIKFITYIDSLDQSADVVKQHLADDFCNDETDVTSENSHANVLAALRTFALSFRQVVSDFPLQTENLQRTEKCSTRRVQLSVVEASDENHDLLPSNDLSFENLSLIHISEPTRPY